MINIEALQKRRAELVAAMDNAQRVFNQIDGRLQEIDAMINYCQQLPAQTGNDVFNVDLDEGQHKTITTP
jgi:ABC-type transporter Mla subunit MlaD